MMPKHAHLLQSCQSLDFPQCTLIKNTWSRSERGILAPERHDDLLIGIHDKLDTMVASLQDLISTVKDKIVNISNHKVSKLGHC